MTDQIQEVDIEWISVNPNQPRRFFSLSDLEELAGSIEEIGLIHPPVVRMITKEQFELVAGERRFRALKLLKKQRIPVLVTEMSDLASSRSALIENIQRVDLNPMEVAEALKKLIEQNGFTQELLADKIGKKRSTVANFLRLLHLPKEVQQQIQEGSLTMGHAKAVLSLPKAMQLEFSLKILTGQWTVRQTEKRAREILASGMPPMKKKDVHLEDIKKRLEERLGTKVLVNQSKIILDYYGWEDLDRLLELLGCSSCSV